MMTINSSLFMHSITRFGIYLGKIELFANRPLLGKKQYHLELKINYSHIQLAFLRSLLYFLYYRAREFGAT